MSDHQMQHADAPTWCIWCGDFDVYCRPGECRADRSQPARFDFRELVNAERQLESMFGKVENSGN